MGGLVPVDNIPTVTIDATSVKITGFDHIVLDTTPGLGKSLDDYILSAKYAISTYMPYLDTASLVVKNAASMAEHSSAYAYGFILFDYYVEDIRTAMRVSVFFYGGKIISIGVYDFFDLSALDKASLAFDAKAHTAMLTSFADYACGDMEKLSSTVSEGVLVMGARGEYAISYEVTVTARDAEQREYSHTFTLEIELDCS